MLNKIMIMGRLGSDVEVRKTSGGKSVASATLAVDRDFGDKETDWIPVVAWGNTADFFGNYFSKGRMAVVVGRLQIRKWEDKEGKKRSTAEVIAESIYFGGSKDDGTKSNNFAIIDEPDDQLPF